MKNYFIVFGVFLWLNIPLVMANSSQEPVLTIVETNCKKIYRIQLFDNGEINYVGVLGIKKLGKHKAKIKKSLVINLLNELRKIETMKDYDKYSQFKGISIASSGIRLRKNNQTHDFFIPYDTSDLYDLENFKKNTIKKINLEKWIATHKEGKCMNGRNYVYPFQEFNK